MLRIMSWITVEGPFTIVGVTMEHTGNPRSVFYRILAFGLPRFCLSLPLCSFRYAREASYCRLRRHSRNDAWLLHGQKKRPPATVETTSKGTCHNDNVYTLRSKQHGENDAQRGETAALLLVHYRTTNKTAHLRTALRRNQAQYSRHTTTLPPKTYMRVRYQPPNRMPLELFAGAYP